MVSNLINKKKLWPSLTLIITCVLGTLLISNISFAKDSKLTLGVYPHLSKKHLNRAYLPIANKLSEAIGMNVEFDVDDNLKNFHTNIGKQFYDIIFVQPVDYIQLADEQKYDALATQIKPLRAIFVVKDSSNLTKIHNLLGRDVYFPPRQTAVSYLAKYHLKNSGINLSKDLNTYNEKTHIACLQKLLFGIADTCVTLDNALHFFEQKVGVKLRVIGSSVEIPHVLFAVRPNLDTNITSKLLNEIVSWKMDNDGKRLLKPAKLGPFKKTSDKEYDIMRKIKKEVDNY